MADERARPQHRLAVRECLAAGASGYEDRFRRIRIGDESYRVEALF